MNRKHFLSSVIPLVSVAAAVKGKSVAGAEYDTPVKTPPYLQKNDAVGITCPSGFITMEDIQPAVEKLREWGFRIRIGNTVGARDFTFAGR